MLLQLGLRMGRYSCLKSPLVSWELSAPGAALSWPLLPSRCQVEVCCWWRPSLMIPLNQPPPGTCSFTPPSSFPSQPLQPPKITVFIQFSPCLFLLLEHWQPVSFVTFVCFRFRMPHIRDDVQPQTFPEPYAFEDPATLDGFLQGHSSTLSHLSASWKTWHISTLSSHCSFHLQPCLHLHTFSLFS